MGRDSFIAHVKMRDIYNDISEDVEKRFNTSNYEVDRPLPTGINKKLLGLMQNESRGKIITEFVRQISEHTVIQKTTVMKVKNQKVQKACSKKKT